MEADLKNGINQAIKAFGSGTRLAEFIGRTPQAIYQWTCIPVVHVDKISRETKIPKWILRPDLYQVGDK